jgi:hypothetical protein
MLLCPAASVHEPSKVPTGVVPPLLVKGVTWYVTLSMTIVAVPARGNVSTGMVPEALPVSGPKAGTWVSGMAILTVMA